MSAERRGRGAGTRPAALVLAVVLGCNRADDAPPPPAPAATLLGGERGLDHVGIAVRDLARARRTFHHLLGFGRPESGKLPNGIENVNYYFEDATYLETLTAYDPASARWLAEFTAAREGVVFAALSVRSASETARFLAQRGFATAPPQPGSIRTAGQESAPREMWQTLFFQGSPLPAGPIFFIAYAQPERAATLGELAKLRRSRYLYRHPNTAVGVKAVWLAVGELASAATAFAAIGLEVGQSFSDPRLGAIGKVVRAGAGKILLLAPSEPRGAVARHLQERGPSPMGLSVEVTALAAAQRRIYVASRRALEASRSVLGASVLVPPELAHGAWLELFEERAP